MGDRNRSVKKADFVIRILKLIAGITLIVFAALLALFALLFVLVPNSQQEAKPLPVIITMLVMASIFGLISVCFFVVGFQLVVLKSGNGPSIGVHIPSSNYPGTQNLLSPRNQTEPLSTRQESTIWEGHPSQLTNLVTFTICGLFFWLLIPIAVAVWRFLIVQTTRYELTTQRFRLSYGVISKTIHEVELYRVKDTRFTQSIFQRIFNLATVTLISSDSMTPFTSIEDIPANTAKILRERLRSFVEELRDRKRVREIDYT